MKYTFFALVFALFISCDDDKKAEDIDYVAKNELEITEYIKDNSLNAQKGENGLYYVIDEPGEGKQPTASSQVTVAYKGTFINGKKFDESGAEGITFGLNQVISGWTMGIPYFKEGGSGMLLVPAHLGYGNRDYGPIPGGSVLIFDVKLIAVN
ncbi:FKBP-type peptidyl-prolyl cis-trans isomerase [Arenibacter nanhaiticus]|uniref:Peptidyl-prolyl cis-trans isomerase n=1 Tax=Arenibacter nanhaiticus TaxID=558155 RepID=A0A1M6H9U9_9FLAO|nr:FKBP-type peptidyl-prolyl cis-trans isomerase [Arenibacter nanhaiticus]SHJ18936.1 FKBP-type peptidyl-prolyl cis-trans isomerase [Arenibacter nanhaiticus]